MTVVETPNGTVGTAAPDDELLTELLLVMGTVVPLLWVDEGTLKLKRPGRGTGFGVTRAS
jgi:hypothetical protein